VKPPDDLTPYGRGRRFWRRTFEAFELSDPERELLGEVCRCLDTLDVLREAVEEHGAMVEGSTGQLVVNPAVIEARQSRALLARLLAQLDLPDETGAALDSPATTRAKRAARVRWGTDGTA
jgi:hypothetical protein